VTTTEKPRNRIKELVRITRLLAATAQGQTDTSKSDKIYFQMLLAYYNRILNAAQEGKLLAGHTVNFPSEILYAMDIVPMHTEGTMWMAVLFLRQSAEMLASGAEQGLAPEVCSAHRALAGAFKTGVLPRLDMMVWSNLVCDNTSKSGELLMELNHCPGFFLDHPFKRNETEIGYLTGELEDLIAFLEQQTGRKYNPEKLGEIVAGINRQIELEREIAELRKAVPTVLSPQGFFKILMVDYFFPGQPEGTAYLETLRDELADMVKQHKGWLPNERFRVMTLFIPPIYMIGKLDKLFAEFGIASAIEPYFCSWREGRLDPSRPVESIARKSFMSPLVRMYGPLDDQSLQYFIDAAKEYRIDGAINYAHIGCRQSCATLKLLKDMLGRMDVPVLNLDCDIIDSTSASEDEIHNKVEQFFELLQDR
jgi:benzoyl-CoA reductase/2-hydroxyglutaryl-CoA dehydratase subunit BcrC/BadD/HgdB